MKTVNNLIISKAHTGNTISPVFNYGLATVLYTNLLYTWLDILAIIPAGQQYIASFKFDSSGIDLLAPRYINKDSITLTIQIWVLVKRT